MTRHQQAPDRLLVPLPRLPSRRAIMDAYGAEMIAGSTTPTTKEGSFNGNWAAVLRFPSIEVAEAWYNSPEYEPFKKLRINELTDLQSVVFVEGR